MAGRTAGAQSETKNRTEHTLERGTLLSPLDALWNRSCRRRRHQVLASVTDKMDAWGSIPGKHDQGTLDSSNCSGKVATIEELRRRANTCLDEGRLSEARRDYIRAALLAPNKHVWPYIGIGVIALKCHDLGEAEMAYQLACQLKHGCVEAHCGLARVYLLQKRYEAAASTYATALRLEPDNLVAIAGLFQLCRQTGRFLSIIEPLKGYLKKHPDDMLILSCLAFAYLRNNQPKVAVVLTERIQELEAAVAHLVPDMNNVRGL